MKNFNPSQEDQWLFKLLTYWLFTLLSTYPVRIDSNILILEYVSSQDCVVTCFFIDCAHNILQFVQTIHQVLKSGGTWINLGPLLYHFADIRGEDSIEPDYQVRIVINI